MRLVHYFSQDEGRPIDFIEMTERPDFQEAVECLRITWKVDVDFISEGNQNVQDERGAFQFISWDNLFLPIQKIAKEASTLQSRLEPLTNVASKRRNEHLYADSSLMLPD